MRLYSPIGDEAISIEGARRVLQGQIPGRDFFEVVGPAEFYWQALFLRMFGVNIAVTRGLFCATGISLALLIYHLARRLGANTWLCAAIFVVAGIVWFPVSSYHWDSDLFVLAAFVCFVEWQRKPRASLLLLAAGLAGIATVIVQQKGLLLSAALITSAFLVCKRMRAWDIVSFTAVYSTPLLATALFYIAQGAWRDLLWTNVIWPLQRFVQLAHCPYGMALQSHLASVSLIQPQQRISAMVLSSVIGWPLCFVVLLPALLLCCAALLGRRAFSVSFLPFWICGGALWISEIQRPDYPHLAFGCPIWIVLFWALVRENNAIYRLLSRPFSVSLVLLCLVEFALALMSPVKLEGRNGTLYGSHPDEVLEFLEQHTARGENVFIYPYYATYNFLSDTANPTRFTYLLHGFHTTEQFREVIGDLERKRVRLVLWDTSFTPQTWRRLFPAYVEPRPADLTLEAYLSSHYHQIGLRNGYRLMERNSPHAVSSGER